MAGSSGTPLAKKLGITPGMTMALRSPSWPYAALPPRLDVIHHFTPRREVPARRLTEARAKMARDGMIRVSWPKTAPKHKSKVTGDTVRRLCLPLGRVDLSVGAADELWSGLAPVIRKELRHMPWRQAPVSSRRRRGRRSPS